MSTLTDLNPLF